MKSKITFIFLFCSFAVFSQQQKKVSHTFFAIGCTCNEDSVATLTALTTAAKTEGNSTLLFLGNSAAIDGFSEDDFAATKNLTLQAQLLKSYTGNVFFIPGAADWNAGLKGIKDQEKFIENALNNKKAFQPQDGCPVKKITINYDTDLLILDSQWALMDWNNYPDLNQGCDIKSKAAFYTAVESEIVKSQDKTVLVAMFHPVASNGKYSGGFGIDPQGINNVYYKELSDRLLTIAQRFKNLVFLSGHEDNQQYLIEKNIPVIINGFGDSTSGNGKKVPGNKFFSSVPGFSKITSYTDGSLTVAFYNNSNNFSSPVFETEVIAAPKVITLPDFNEYKTLQYVYKSIYTPEELDHSAAFKALWGKHYRKDYITPIKLKAALLDTLYGGLSLVRKGGGHQTNSIRLQDKNGREYTMRNAKKSALRFIQYFIFKTQYLSPDVANTYFISLLQDYWTTANPYGSLTIADLSDAIQIYHANPHMYYIPKQAALGVYNEEYGDNIYFIEEQISSGQGDKANFGYHDKIIGTDDLLEKIQRKDRVSINESLYIRTRLFDNIIGDFDRHADQWRWAEDKKEDGSLYYSPIPRDRDQAFSDFDGFILGAVTALNPQLRFMQRYKTKYRSLRWLNDAGDDVDRAVLKNDTEEDWVREAKFIKEHLTETIVNTAFTKFPEGIDKEKEAKIKEALLGRIAGIEAHAAKMFRYTKSFVMITGSEKDDWFVITRMPNGMTNIKGYRIENDTKGSLFWNVDYNSAITKEIWLYGQEGKDVFEVNGDGDNLVSIKIMGGQNNDTYRITNNSSLRIFDQKSKPNTFETPAHKTLSDDYDLNNYDFMKGRKNVSSILPIIGYNPDDGFAVGAGYVYTVNGLRRNPFTAQHSLKASYYTATSGINFDYAGEFANIFNKINMGIKAGYTSPFYTNNFFGLGNDTPYDRDNIDYNRLRKKSVWFSPSLIYRGYYGSVVTLGLNYEHIEVERTRDRYIITAPVNPNVFSGQDITGAEASYAYNNFNNVALPSKGIGFSITGGYKANFNESKGFGYVVPEVRLTTNIDKRGIFVYATKLKAKYIFNNSFEFYQAATIGDGDGLRGFRRERFSGKTSLYHNSDLRIDFGKLANGVIPITFGCYAGFDYGRVWVDNDESSKWHTSPGGGLYFNIAGLTTANIAYFSSSDGGRLNIKLQLSF